jgi:hypothetical protein
LLVAKIFPFVMSVLVIYYVENAKKVVMERGAERH